MHQNHAFGLLALSLCALGACANRDYVREDQRAAAEDELSTRQAQRVAPGARGAGTEYQPEGETTGPRDLARAPYLGTDAIERAKIRRPGGPAEASPPSPWVPRVVQLDLTAQGLPLTLQVPDGAAAFTEPGVVRILHGSRFLLELGMTPVDIAARRREIQDDDVHKLRRFVLDSADALVYEAFWTSGLTGMAEFHFVANVTAGGHIFRCEDSKSAAFTLPEVQAMLEACQSLAEK